MTTPHPLISRFHEFCRRRNLIPDGSGVVVAVSGGVDSTVLLDILAEERRSFGLRLVVAHFNHQLRGGESDEDERFVADLAVHYGCELYVERANTAERASQKKRGIQETARDLRYEFFGRLRESLAYDVIATAHNADDNVETMLLHLFRGAGLRGLSGIPIARQELVRPLLFASRAEIEAYAAARCLRFRNDSSNETDHYARNIIRHHIVPRVKASINPAAVESMARSAELFRDLDVYLRETSNAILERSTDRKKGGELHLSIAELSAHPVLLQQYLVMRVHRDVTGGDADQATIDALLRLCSSGTGSWVTLRGGWRAHHDRERLVFRQAVELPDFSLSVELGMHYELGQYGFTSELLHDGTVYENRPGNIEYVDLDMIGGDTLILRSWREGDWFVPLGLGGRKKISDFLIDARVPRYSKHHFPVLTTERGEVVWLCGKRLDDRFKLTEHTRRMGKLAFEPRDIERTDAAIDQSQW